MTSIRHESVVKGLQGCPSSRFSGVLLRIGGNKAMPARVGAALVRIRKGAAVAVAGLPGPRLESLGKPAGPGVRICVGGLRAQGQDPLWEGLQARCLDPYVGGPSGPMLLSPVAAIRHKSIGPEGPPTRQRSPGPRSPKNNGPEGPLRDPSWRRPRTPRSDRRRFDQ
ncbi:DUF6053 domain-containing protein [Lysobacter enzymogenes]|uniref:DUF6053 domain-containing protein n=1 Tax=Lysobacter enzymogenes TaxID=69 RepID=UPI003D18A862